MKIFYIERHNIADGRLDGFWMAESENAESVYDNFYIVIVIILLLTLRIIATLQFTGRKCSLFAGSLLATPAAYIKRKYAEPA